MFIIIVLQKSFVALRGLAINRFNVVDRFSTRNELLLTLEVFVMLVIVIRD